MNIYRLRATCLCSASDGRDHYDVEIRSERMILVEDIVLFFDDHANQRIYQEDLATRARNELAAEVKIIGQHPSPVTAEVVVD